MRQFCVVVTIVFCSLAVSGAFAASDRLWFGGGIGFGFGDVDYVEVSPLIGYAATEKLDVGGGITYRYRDDDRYADSLSTSDYGANLFVRYSFLPQLFGHVEYEYLSYEFRIGSSTDRDNFSSVLAGPGFAQALGDRVSLYALALYNFSYDSDDLSSPYDDDWTYRVGVGFGF